MKTSGEILRDTISMIQNNYNSETILDSPIVTPYETTNTITKQESDKKMRTEQIIDLWYERCSKNMDVHYTEKQKQIIDNDTINQKIKKTISELDEDLKEYEMTISDKLPISILNSMTKESKLKIKEMHQEYEETVKDLVELKREIKVMVSACETYEQEIKVLKDYEIIDDIGQISPWEYWEDFKSE